MLSNLQSPHAWLASQPLQASERLYAIVSNTSDADPLMSYRLNDGAQTPLPLWADTPYATWHAVMPYLLELRADSGFLDWIAETDAQDWGWLAVSTRTPQQAAEHVRSLTQVLMPDATAVFMRFWDGRHFYPILEGLGTGAADVLPVFDRYLINGNSLDVNPAVVPPAKAWPWWEVPQTLLDQLAAKDPSTLIDNLMQWLSEERPDIYAAFPQAVLRHKIARLVRRPDTPPALGEALLNHLIMEQG